MASQTSIIPPQPIAVNLPGVPGILFGGGDYRPKNLEVDTSIRLSEGFECYSTAAWLDTNKPQVHTMAITPTAIDRASLGKFISFLRAQLTAGKRVYLGFSSGRNRVSTILAILHNAITGSETSIEWVRKNYRTDAFTEARWVDFLVEKFKLVAPEGMELAPYDPKNAIKFSDEVVAEPVAETVAPAADFEEEASGTSQP